MSDTTAKNQSRNCLGCGKPVVDNGTGGIAHAGGGTVDQECRNCGWMGGQVGKFLQCPRCGDATCLVDDHSAR